MPVEGRDLSSRQTQYVVKDLGDWETYKLRKGFRNCRWRCTRKQRREVLSESRMHIGDLEHHRHQRAAHLESDDRGRDEPDQACRARFDASEMSPSRIDRRA